jgi:hypothetical protein
MKTVRDPQTHDWILKLRDDLVRVNRSIKKERDKVDTCIGNIKVLEQERENLIDNIQDTDNIEDYV